MTLGENFLGFPLSVQLILIVLTSWPLLLESLLTCLLGFLPNLLTELALNISCSVVLLIGTVPSGHDSPEILHNWTLSSNIPDGIWPSGLSGGSYNFKQKKSHYYQFKFTSLAPKYELWDLQINSLSKFQLTNGFCPLSWGWSKAGCRWDITQSMISPSGLCSNKKQK